MNYVGFEKKKGNAKVYLYKYRDDNERTLYSSKRPDDYNRRKTLSEIAIGTFSNKASIDFPAN